VKRCVFWSLMHRLRRAGVQTSVSGAPTVILGKDHSAPLSQIVSDP
jgi:hypothetical protein